MKNTYHNSFFAMNTRCHVVFPNLDQHFADHVFHILKLEINRIEGKLSRFIPDSDLSKLNKTAFKQPAILDDELFDILTTCQEYWELTDGAFDVTLRPCMNFWNQRKESDRSKEEFDTIFSKLGMNHIHLNNNDRSVTFDNDLIEIDLGGFGKGYAMEKVRKLLDKKNVENAFISFGESSILTLGSHPAGDCWKMGINNYLKPGSSIHEFRMNDSSMSTSANFYLTDNGKLCNHKHVISPESGQPLHDCVSVSVCTESSQKAEILSTAFLVSQDSVIRNAKKKIEGLNVVRVDYSSNEANVKEF